MCARKKARENPLKYRSSLPQNRLERPRKSRSQETIGEYKAFSINALGIA